MRTSPRTRRAVQVILAQGEASPTSPSSSTSSHATSWAGGPAPRCRPTSCSTRWIRRCVRAGPRVTGSWCTTVTAARSTSRSATASDWPRPASSRRWAAPATATTTRWTRPSTGCARPRSSPRRGPWKRTREAVELATLEWVSWFNHQRLLEPIGYIPPAEAEANDWRQNAPATSTTKAARVAEQQEG